MRVTSLIYSCEHCHWQSKLEPTDRVLLTHEQCKTSALTKDKENLSTEISQLQWRLNILREALLENNVELPICYV